MVIITARGSPVRRSAMCLGCVQVWEHLPARHENALVDALCAAATRGIVVSVATPGQGGLGHVNEREHAYVVGAIRARDRRFRVDEAAQQQLRRCSHLSWFRANMLVFRRDPQWKGE